MKNGKKIYQDPWEVLDDYAPEVKLSHLPFLIVILLLFGGLGWYIGKHPKVQEFIKNLGKTQQESTLKSPPPEETLVCTRTKGGNDEAHLYF